MVSEILSKVFGPHWRTSVSSMIAVLFGFIAMSPQYFSHWPMLVDIARYAALGGLVSLGINVPDRQSVPKA